MRQAGTGPAKLYTLSIPTIYIGLGLASLSLVVFYMLKNKKGMQDRIIRIAFCLALFVPMGITYQQFNMKLDSKFIKEYKEKWEVVQRLEQESNANSQPTLK